MKTFKADPCAYDLVLTDMAMPNLTGDLLAKELLATGPDIPIILCTGFSERITPDAAQKIGIRGFLTKPIQIADLARTIKIALGA